MRYLFFIFFISNTLLSQVQIKPLLEEMPNDSVSELSLTIHTSILPSIENKRVQDKSKTGYILQNQNNYFRANALVDGLFSSVSNQHRGGIGALMESQISNKFYFRLTAISGFGSAESSFLAPKSYLFTSKKDSTFSYTDIRGRLSFSPNKVFNFQAGIDNQFIGEGCRSLLLSDYSVPAPFGQIRTKFWRLEYLMLYQFYREQFKSNWKNKFSGTHYLSINALKWLNVGFFETVLFQPKDTTLNRGFDAEYLNPIVFYRPQEYSMGSSDNIILGMHFSAKYKGHTLYGQIVLDEFLLGELRAKSKWWGNKYGAQLGVKGRFTNKLGNFFYRSEFNFARPYTYSHAHYSENYGNQGYALAHPYGASFAELLGELKWQKEKLSLKFFANYFLRGFDNGEGKSYGGDIYQSYNNRAKEYKNTIGQGIGANGTRMILSVAYRVDKSTNLQLFLENHLRWNTAFKEPNYYFLIGIRSCLWNDYRNY